MAEISDMADAATFQDHYEGSHVIRSSYNIDDDSPPSNGVI